MASRILLIIPKFYEIEKKIVILLREFGNEVYYIENKEIAFDYSNKTSKFRYIRRFYFFLFSPRERYIKIELAKIENLRFDILFSINCFTVCPNLLNRLKYFNPGLRSILYLWDSFSKYSWENRIRLFDKIFTFDIYDSLKYNIEYLPNFYFNVTDSQKNEIVNDLSFIGKFSPERLLIIDRLVPHISEKNIKYFFLLRPSFKMSFHNYYFYRLLKYLKINNRWVINYISIFEANSMILKRNFIKSDNLSFEEAQKTMQNSNVILDLPYSDQTGYTHRIIAALANGKKILTTNPGIVNESFFNQDQIHILNPDKPEIDIKWIKEKVGFCVNPYFNKLELKSWLNHILNGMVA